MAFVIQSLYSGGLIVNYRCPASCGHCLYACGPRREAGYMTAETAGRIGDRLLAFGCGAVHIGGGEPLLDPQGLVRVLDTLRAKGVTVEYVETNCFWGTSQARARDVARMLLGHGQTRVLVSIDPFHTAAVPFRRVLTAIEACEAEGLSVLPWRLEFAEEIQRLDPVRTHGMEEYAAVFGADYPLRVFRRYGLTLGGRALMTFRDRLPKKPADTLAREPSPCRRLGETSHFHVDLHGGYIPCLCTGFSIPLDAIGQPLERFEALSLLYREGVGGFLEWARRRGGFIERAGGYCHACDLCLDIRRQVIRAARDVPEEFGPPDFYRAV